MEKSYLRLNFLKFTSAICAILFSCNSFSQTNFGWIEKGGFPGPARHRAIGASVGNRGYMGLGHINSVFDVLFDDWFEYDPGTDTWSQKANFPGGPRMHPTAFVIANKIYVGTGRDVNTTLYNDFYCYDPATNMWVSIAPFPGAPRRGAVAFTLNGLGYVGTGSYHSNFYKYDPATDSWASVQNLPGTGRISAVACAINGKGYLSTGDDGGPNNDMWEYDPTLNSWTAKATLPGLPRMEACGFAMGGKFFVGTGDDFSSGTNYQDFWSYDPVTDSWLQLGDFAGAARRYMSSFVIGNRAYTSLGTSGINYADLWEFGSISGIEENTNDNNNLTVYPNPIIDVATIHFSSSVKNASLILTGIEGKRIWIVNSVSGDQFQFEKNNLASGIYFLQLNEPGKNSVTKKICLQ
ncbi:hypothetical protein BH09BAC5_BH09BAC5_15500 [soil metagenome]